MEETPAKEEPKEPKEPETRFNGKLNGKPAEEILKEIPVMSRDEAAPPNECYIEDHVMVLKMYLWGDAAYAKTVGSLELAKDVVKNHFTALAAANMLKRQKTGIIRPN